MLVASTVDVGDSIAGVADLDVDPIPDPSPDNEDVRE